MATLPPAAAAPRAEPDGSIRLRVEPGDTLIGIGTRLLEPPGRWRDLQRLNRIADPRRLAPGTQLRIDPSWLRGEASGWVVEAAGGDARIDDVAAHPGLSGGEGARVRTGADGIVVLRLRDGTSLRVPPASTIRFERLREYLGPEAVEAVVGVERGGVETQSPPTRPRGLRIRTPAATAAVRGTEFRVRSIDDATAVEVLTGSVGASGPGGSAAVAAGDGAVATLDRPPRVEPLLPAPALDGLPARIETAAATLPFEPVAGAARYAIRIAYDEGFTRLLVLSREAAPALAFSTREDGRLYVRARAVSALGLEGREARTSIEVAARPEPPLPLGPAPRAVIFESMLEPRWTEPEGVDGFRVQVAASADFAAPLLDAVVREARASVPLPPLAEGTRTWWWRVASVAGARTGPFPPARTVEQRPPGGAPSGSVDDDSLVLAWPDLPGHRWQLQVAAEPGFAAPLLQRELDVPRATLDGLAPGTWWVRTRSVDPQGVVAPFGPSQRFTVPSLLRTGAGAPVRSGHGEPVGLQPPR